MNGDWLFWLGGALVGAGGLALCAWALFADRSKGRKRCPKCWYNMSRTEALRCPECGREPKREKKLFKTRRRWKWAFASLVLFLVAGLLTVQPKVRRDGWGSILPNTGLIAALYLPNHGWALDEIRERVTLGGHDLWLWQWSLLEGRMERVLTNENESLQHRQAALFLTVTSASKAGNANQVSRAYSIIAIVLNDPNPKLREPAVLLVAGCPDEELAIQLIVPKLGDPDAGVQTNAAGALMMADQNNSRAWPALKQALGHTSPEVRSAAAYFASSIAERHNETETIFDKLLTMYQSDSDDVARSRAVRGIAKLKIEAPRVENVLLSAMKDPSPKVRSQAMNAVWSLDNATPELTEALANGLDDDDTSVAQAAAGCLEFIRPPALLLPHVQRLRSKAQTIGDAQTRQRVEHAIERSMKRADEGQ